jgi:cellulose synthase/poly-beta-1,6-N-acetylglucosamine synthase-like glycosyltransferase
MPVVSLADNDTLHVPAASVIMPSYQSAGHIRFALAGLLAQKTGLAYEIIVVDSSTDGADAIVRHEFPQVRLLHFAEQCQVGAARNIGVQAARGGVILFLDTDTVPVPAWIDQMYRAIREQGADAAGGSISNGTPWSITGSMGFYLEFFRFLAYDGEPRPARFLMGGNSAFRRDVLSGVEYVEHSTGEDMLLSSRLARDGRKLLFLPRAAVKHLNRTGFRRVLGYQVKLGRGAFLYRSADSPDQVRLLRSLPLLTFLMPLGMLPWIGFSLLRRQLADFLRFLVVAPICLVANTGWAFGFFQALRASRR